MIRYRLPDSEEGSTVWKGSEIKVPDNDTMFRNFQESIKKIKEDTGKAEPQIYIVGQELYDFLTKEGL